MQELDFIYYWRVIVKHRSIILTFFLVCVITVAIYSLRMSPVYRATAQILIEKANPNILSTQELVAIDTRGTDFYQTQYQLLESRSLAREVIKRLDLSNHPEFRQPVDEEADPSAHTGDENSEISSNDDSSLVNAFLQRLNIEPIRNTRLVKINFESTDPQLAAEASNALAQAYMDWNLGLRVQTQQSMGVFLNEQVKEAKRKLETSEQALQQYREKHGVTDLNGSGGKGASGQDVSRLKLTQVNAQLVEAANKRIEAEILYQNAREALQNPDQAESIPGVVNNPVIVNIKNQELELLRQKEQGQRLGPKHPTMIGLNEEIENLRKKKYIEIQNVVESLKGGYEAALAQERSLQTALEKSKTETIERDKIAIQYQFLQHEVESNRELYDLLFRRLKETNVSEENKAVNIHMVDPAELPKTPAKPRIKMNIMMACLIGLAGGLSLAFFLEYLDNTIKTPEDLRQHFSNLPCLGHVPKFDFIPDDPQSELILLTNPKSPVSESYRGMRTSILLSTPGHSPRSLLVTSSVPLEGKSITSANMAIAMAHAGQKILVLDCDMRHPKLHRLFSCERDQGVSNILVGGADWHHMRVTTDAPNLDFIPSGPIPPNPAELVGSDHMKTLIQEALKEYDRIIIDSPPVASVTDPVVLASLVDGVVLVIRGGATGRNVIANSIRQLNDVQARVLGAVLNAVNVTKESYYYYYYYYGSDTKLKKHKRL